MRVRDCTPKTPARINWPRTPEHGVPVICLKRYGRCTVAVLLPSGQVTAVPPRRLSAR